VLDFDKRIFYFILILNTFQFSGSENTNDDERLDRHIELSQANSEAIKAVIAEAKSAFGRSSVPESQWPKFPEIKTKVPDEVSVV